jgi:hypothetical protein
MLCFPVIPVAINAPAAPTPQATWFVIDVEGVKSAGTDAVDAKRATTAMKPIAKIKSFAQPGMESPKKLEEEEEEEEDFSDANSSKDLISCL